MTITSYLQEINIQLSDLREQLIDLLEDRVDKTTLELFDVNDSMQLTYLCQKTQDIHAHVKKIAPIPLSPDYTDSESIYAQIFNVHNNIQYCNNLLRYTLKIYDIDFNNSNKMHELIRFLEDIKLLTTIHVVDVFTAYDNIDYGTIVVSGPELANLTDEVVFTINKQSFSGINGTKTVIVDGVPVKTLSSDATSFSYKFSSDGYHSVRIVDSGIISNSFMIKIHYIYQPTFSLENPTPTNHIGNNAYSVVQQNGEITMIDACLQDGWINKPKWECNFDVKWNNLRYQWFAVLMAFPEKRLLGGWEGCLANPQPDLGTNVTRTPDDCLTVLHQPILNNPSTDWIHVKVERINNDTLVVTKTNDTEGNGTVTLSGCDLLSTYDRLTIGVTSNRGEVKGQPTIKNLIVEEIEEE